MATELEFVNYKQFVESLPEVDEFASTDKNVVSNSTNGPRCVPQSVVDGNSLKSFRISSNDEYSVFIVDGSDKFLFGLTIDGKVTWAYGVPAPVKKMIIDYVSDKVVKEEGKGLIDIVFAGSAGHESSDEYIDVVKDSDGKVVEAVQKDGKKFYFCRPKFIDGVDFNKKTIDDLKTALKFFNVPIGLFDWSDSKNLAIGKPRLSIINFSGISAFPLNKTDDMRAVIEFWDLNGNYFKKTCVLNAQGNSTMSFPKKNINLDLCDEEWDGKFGLRIGDWIEMDSYHLKAYYNDFFKGVGCVLYDLADEIYKTRGVEKDAAWKVALVDQGAYGDGEKNAVGNSSKLSNRYDNGAVCHPMGFPCVVFLNGSFYGLFCWQIKKSRDNYQMKKNNSKHIHIDGYFFHGIFDKNGSVLWNEFEVRNPKGLKDVNGNDYDGDNPTELSGTDPFTSEVKNSIVALSEAMTTIKDSAVSLGIQSEEFKAVFETYFDVDNLIDLIVYSDFTHNADSSNANTQWITYDGVKWFAELYDLDNSLGFFNNRYYGWFMDPDELVHSDSMYSPDYYIMHNDDYRASLEARYFELRKSGILSLENIVNKVRNLILNYSPLYFEKEHEKWQNTYGNSNSVVNEDYWSLVKENDEYVFGESNTYNSETSYSVGDNVFFGAGKFNGYYKFVCTSPCSGEPPFKQMAVIDSLWRLVNWMTRHIIYVDNFYHYENS